MPASPCWSSEMSPTSRKPACSMDEYASIRFTSVWVRPRIAPTAMVMIATAQMIGRQSHRVVVNAT